MKHRKLPTSKATSKRMSRVKLKEGKAETKLAKALWHSGIRYQKNYKKLPGSPDIAITKYQIAVFIDGDFWHGKDWEQRKPKLKNNRDYWIEKIEENMSRDKRNNNRLKELGWMVIRFWEKDVLEDLAYCVTVINEAIDFVINNEEVRN